ncbi:RecQ family ATP-dependent DNA helicase [Lutispora sp.]|uniref:RecQ family ATP-dependent DNA helicase n=1 Tax=Lutispora sp. TaxID=2828727 RepID=UPI0035664455
MKSIAFIDTEIDANSGKILDIGSVKGDGSLFHSSYVHDFTKFLCGSDYVCGHNIFNHDLKYIKNSITDAGINISNLIDTLYLSPLLFPAKPYHSLVKDDKLQTEDINNPLNDSIKSRDLFFDEITAFQQLDTELKRIFYFLLKDKKEFSAFFGFLGYNDKVTDIEQAIRIRFYNHICENANLRDVISLHPVELAYCLALINVNHKYSITPPWVLKSFPAIESIMFLLRGKPCVRGCKYCNEAFDIHKALKRYFGYDSYRTYAGEPLQEKAVRAAVDNKSLLAVFPTGGGKSITFQIPALMSGVSSKGLTVVISPLQSLMKDQVDNLEKMGITDAVAINGLLDPIERAKSFERVEDGSTSILYISPESLRSRTIEHLLLGRNIVRFVIDEAHCLSAWGHDFRVDYLYIGDFIKSIQEKKNLEEGIPVSCFTATAKQKVVEDIRNYFKDKLSLELELYCTSASRTNLRYRVFKRESEEEKYNTMRDLIDSKRCPTIIYVSRTGKTYSLANRLTKDGYTAKPYHGKMDKQEKAMNQDAFLKGEIQIMVATSAFGMGVDKKDVGMVIHYEISDSLENYIQEAGRAGRDETIFADCYVLFNDEDLNKHFILLNQTKLSIKEIQQIWKAIKEITKFRLKASQSALEIARKAGWDDSVAEIENRVTTAIAALEEAGYLKRGQNMVRVFANSILSKNVKEAIEKINMSDKFQDKQREKAVRIIKKLFSSKSRKHLSDEEAESRIDYISDHLGIVKEEVIKIVNLLREEKILADTKDLTAFIRSKDNKNHSLSILKSFWQIESFLLTIIENEEKIFHIKELNELAEKYGCQDVNPYKIKTILNFWAIKNWIKKQTLDRSRNHIQVICLHKKEELEDKLTKRYELAQFIIEYLYEISKTQKAGNNESKEEVLVEFSELAIKQEFESRLTLLSAKVSLEDIEDALFYLSKIEALKIEGGFLVVYNALTIERIEKDNKKRYKIEDYQKLNQFYINKVQQIHIVGEYARKMIDDYKGALQFVDDYFQLNYNSFLNKYFKGSRQNEIKRNITPSKFKQLFGELSLTQLKVINDSESKHIVVAAGPGSGKTRILAHKLASLYLMEDVKHEQMLMVTFSRSAATEFKKRLLRLIGNASNFIEIKTFHSYCFDLMGKVGTIEMSAEVIREAIKRIKNGDIDVGRITKTVLVIDEAQDMDADEFDLINTLMEFNEEMRVIAVGDDDQNIFEFRGSSSIYMEKLINEKKATMYEMVENYRSKSNIVDLANQFASKISHRLKKTPIIAMQNENGKIKIVKYKSCNLINPTVNDILSEDLSGSTCVLTKTNEEAMQIAGLLSKNKIQAKPIQSNDGFNLYNLEEVRFFLDQLNISKGVYTISDDMWDKAKRNLKEKFDKSLNFDLCMNMIKDFEMTNTKSKYVSDLEIFIRESNLEDFFGENRETVFISTIHKAKGREFDNVFLMLDQFNCETDEARRLLYVAMTRAKQNLTIHYNGSYLDNIKTESLVYNYDSKSYTPPVELTMQLGFRDLWLDSFLPFQHLISEVNSGDQLYIDGYCCCNSKGQPLLKFSKQFKKKVKTLKQSNYVLKTARIRFIIYWRKENFEREIKVILPEVCFERIHD